VRDKIKRLALEADRAERKENYKLLKRGGVVR
jgi:hypothetical protein